MTEQVVAPRSAQFSIGRVLADSFRILIRNALSFLAISLALRLVWFVVAKPNPAAITASSGEFSWSGIVIGPLLATVISQLTQLATMFAVLRNLRGQAASRADFTRGIRFIPAVSMAAIIMSLPALASPLMLSAMARNYSLVGVALTGVGVLSLILMVILWVPTQCIAIEQIGILAGFKRSAQLTKGRRWAIFGLIMIAGIVLLPVFYVISVLSHVPMRELAAAELTSVPGATYHVATAVLSAFYAVVTTVSYYYLCVEKDGFGAMDVARIFE